MACALMLDRHVAIGAQAKRPVIGQENMTPNTGDVSADRSAAVIPALNQARGAVRRGALCPQGVR